MGTVNQQQNGLLIVNAEEAALPDNSFEIVATPTTEIDKTLLKVISSPTAEGKYGERAYAPHGRSQLVHDLALVALFFIVVVQGAAICYLHLQNQVNSHNARMKAYEKPAAFEQQEIEELEEMYRAKELAIPPGKKDPKYEIFPEVSHGRGRSMMADEPKVFEVFPESGCGTVRQEMHDDSGGVKQKSLSKPSSDRDHEFFSSFSRTDAFLTAFLLGIGLACCGCWLSARVVARRWRKMPDTTSMEGQLQESSKENGFPQQVHPMASYELTRHEDFFISSPAAPRGRVQRGGEEETNGHQVSDDLTSPSEKPQQQPLQGEQKDFPVEPTRKLSIDEVGAAAEETTSPIDARKCLVAYVEKWNRNRCPVFGCHKNFADMFFLKKHLKFTHQIQKCDCGHCF